MPAPDPMEDTLVALSAFGGDEFGDASTEIADVSPLLRNIHGPREPAG